jgi:hypothetical protein
MAGKTALDTAVLAGPLTCIDKLDALRGLFAGQIWLPPPLNPSDPANPPGSHHAAGA